MVLFTDGVDTTSRRASYDSTVRLAEVSDAPIYSVDYDTSGGMSPVTGLQSALSGIPEGILYFLGVFKLDVGIPLILGAMLTKFLIRRIPIIG